PFVIQAEDFDSEWWPLVTNVWTSIRKDGVPSEKRRKTKVRSPDLCHTKIRVMRFVNEQKVLVERYPNSQDHTHTIEGSEKLKRSQVVHSLMEEEAIKNYPPPAIVSAIKEYATNRLDLDASIKELKRMEVYNIKKKVNGLQDSHFIGNLNLEMDIDESILFLKKEGYLVERYGQSVQGLVFAHLIQLEKLCRFGWLTLIDSTHKTNRYDWRLFTLYIRDNYSSWDVGAHFFVSAETSEMVAGALQIIRRFKSSWAPRYFLADQSSVETNGIFRAFPGLPKGEQAYDVLFCSVHVVRTWMSKIYEPKIRSKMIHAMHKVTKAGCEELIKEAIDKCQVPDIKRYISRNYTKHTNQWALWARQYSPLLLQITSTNAIESYHSELKRTTISHHGLIGYEILDQIHKFPFPIQQLIISEVHAVEKRIEKGKESPDLMSPNCHCLFFQSGFEVYTGRELVKIDLPKKTEAEKASEKRCLMVNELMERTRNAYWRVEEEGDAVQKAAFIETLSSSLNTVLNLNGRKM
ncbi:1219_t:CDS:2, partial [Scutellospora calospora]